MSVLQSWDPERATQLSTNSGRKSCDKCAKLTIFQPKADS